MEVRPARVDEKDALVGLFARSRAGMTYVPGVSEEAKPRIAADLFENHEDVWIAEEQGPREAHRRRRQHGARAGRSLYAWP